jgi:hypothetical protein
MTEASPAERLEGVHGRLRAILAPYRDRLRVAREGLGGMTLELPEYAGKPWAFAAGTRVGKRYVSYYLMGIYGGAGADSSISPELRRRMQGKSCFNFSKVDEGLFRELEALTARSIERQPALIEAMLASRRRKA